MSIRTRYRRWRRRRIFPRCLGNYELLGLAQINQVCDWLHLEHVHNGDTPYRAWQQIVTACDMGPLEGPLDVLDADRWNEACKRAKRIARRQA
jgi:hypothetical protein